MTAVTDSGAACPIAPGGWVLVSYVSQVCQEAEEAVEELRSQDAATREQLNTATASLQVGHGLCTTPNRHSSTAAWNDIIAATESNCVECQHNRLMSPFAQGCNFCWNTTTGSDCRPSSCDGSLDGESSSIEGTC